MGRKLKYVLKTHKPAMLVGYIQHKCVSWTLSFIWLTFRNCNDSMGRKFK